MNGSARCSHERIKETKSLPLTTRLRQYRSRSFFLLKVKIFRSASRLEISPMGESFYSSNHKISTWDSSYALAFLILCRGNIPGRCSQNCSNPLPRLVFLTCGVALYVGAKLRPLKTRARPSAAEADLCCGFCGTVETVP